MVRRREEQSVAEIIENVERPDFVQEVRYQLPEDWERDPCFKSSLVQNNQRERSNIPC